MSEEKLEEKEEKFERGQPQKIELVMTVRSVYYYDQKEEKQEEESFPLRLHLFRLNIIGSKKEYLFFYEDGNGERIYYVPRQWGYIKLWKERGNIIFSVIEKPLKVICDEGKSEFDWQSIHTDLVIEGPLKDFMESYNKEAIEYILEFLEYP